jgi:hypothetical protein
MIRTLAYISNYTGDKDKVMEDLSKICQKSKISNAINEITGVLFYHNRRFLQLIEGDEIRVHALMKKIRTDTRHKQIEVIIDLDTAQRGFASWNMDTFNLSPSQQIDPELISKVTDLFCLSSKMTGKHFITAAKDVLTHWQTKSFSVI